MPAVGRKPKPEGEARNRNVPHIQWVAVENKPYQHGLPLPAKRGHGLHWPYRTRQWWDTVSRMPHCILWTSDDWEYALETAEVHARFTDGGGVSWATELRHRGRYLGIGWDARRDLRIKYVDAKPDLKPAAEVTPIDKLREL